MRFADVLQELPDGSFSIDYSRFDDVMPAEQAPLDGAAAAETPVATATEPEKRG
jgi:hypothetical protein